MATRKTSHRPRLASDEPEKENAERWLVTYADLLTLLFAFFVVLYAMSQVDPKKYDELSQAFQTAFSGTNLGFVPLESNAPGTRNQTPPVPSLRQKRNALETQLDQRLKTLLDPRHFRVSEVQDGVRISLFSDFFFEPGSPEIQPGAVRLVGKVCDGLKSLPNAVRMEGHTDGSWVEGDRFQHEWQLSTDRALSVLALFFAYGYPEGRVSVAGFGSTRPLASNLTPEGRAMNRRVDLVFLWDRSLGMGFPP